MSKGFLVLKDTKKKNHILKNGVVTPHLVQVEYSQDAKVWLAVYCNSENTDKKNPLPHAVGETKERAYDSLMINIKSGVYK